MRPYPDHHLRHDESHAAGGPTRPVLWSCAGSQATDLVTLLIGVPLLVGAAVGWWRGSTRAGLVLLGALGCFLYGCALGAIAYNELFLLYVVLFSAALYAFVLVLAAFFRQDPARLVPPGTSRRGPAALMFASTVVLVVVWGARWWRPRSPGWPRRGWARTPPSSPRPWIWR